MQSHKQIANRVAIKLCSFECVSHIPRVRAGEGQKLMCAAS